MLGGVHEEHTTAVIVNLVKQSSRQMTTHSVSQSAWTALVVHG